MSSLFFTSFISLFLTSFTFFITRRNFSTLIFLSGYQFYLHVPFFPIIHFLIFYFKFSLFCYHSLLYISRIINHSSIFVRSLLTFRIQTHWPVFHLSPFHFKFIPNFSHCQFHHLIHTIYNSSFICMCQFSPLFHLPFRIRNYIGLFSPIFLNYPTFPYHQFSYSTYHLQFITHR